MSDDPQADRALRIQVMKDRTTKMLATAADWQDCSAVVVIVDHNPAEPLVHVATCVDTEGSIRQIEKAAANSRKDEVAVQKRLAALRENLECWPMLQAAATIRDLIEQAGGPDIRGPLDGETKT